jgi:hypothetical protein
MKKSIIIIFSFFCSINSIAQENLLNELNIETNIESYQLPAFKTMKIGNLQSTKVADKGDFYMIVSHRFGTFKNGLKTFFGFDDANTKMQLLYSFMDGVQVSLSRESLNRTYAGALKIRLFKQSNKFPLNIVAYGTANMNTLINDTQYPELKFGDKMSYVGQLLVSRRVTKNLSLQIAPSFVRQNLQDLRVTKALNHNQFVMGIGGRIKVSKRMSLNADYAYNFNRAKNSLYKNPLTLGLDIETGGHVFQLLFSNAQSTNEPGFLSNAEGNWATGDVFFGFNVVRVF